MALLELPVELLDYIIGFTLPDSLEAFAVCCKRVHGLAKNHILTHNAYKRRWRDFAYRRGGETTEGLQTPQELLLAIAQDPLVARYIEKADFWARPGLPHDTGVERLSSDTTSKDVIAKLVRRSPYLAIAQQDPDAWLDRIFNSPEDDNYDQANMATIVLLTLLPNLRELTLPPTWSELPNPTPRNGTVEDKRVIDPWTVLDAIVHEAHADSARIPALRRLERVFPHAISEYDDRNGLFEIGPFLALPAVSEIYASNCIAVDDGYTGIPFEWRYDYTAYNLCKLELVGCCIDSDGIAEILTHTPQLTTLKYSHSTKWHGCQHDWSAGEFVQAIEQHRGDTLEELAISVKGLFGMVETGVVSMRGFQRLKHVDLDALVFAGPAPDSDERQGIAGTGQLKWTAEKIFCLTDIMPQTVTKVELGITEDVGEAPDEVGLDVLTSLLRAYSAGQPTALPNMKELTLRSPKTVIHWRDCPETPNLHPGEQLDAADLKRTLSEWLCDADDSVHRTWEDEFNDTHRINFGDPY